MRGLAVPTACARDGRRSTMLSTLGIPNPLDTAAAAVGNVVGAAASAAGNAAGGAVSSGLNSVMEGLWTFMVTMLGGTFAWIDHLGAPNVDPRTGPLAGVMPIMLWLARAGPGGFCVFPL